MTKRNDGKRKIAKAKALRNTYEKKKNYVTKTLNKTYITYSGIRIKNEN